MLRKNLAGLTAAVAVMALAGAIPAARAQMMAPMPPPVAGPMPPAAVVPLQGPPEEVEFYSDSPKVEPGDNPANWSARENVIESQRYERLVHTDPAFRAARIRKECGGYSDPAAFQQCAESFN